MTDLVLEPISLGYSCDVKYQVSRNLYFRWRPDYDETQFRNMLFRWLNQPTRFRRHIFDWMIAPLPAVVAYLESDFKGVFELEDLELIEGDRKVRHRTLLTIHPHDFKPGPDGRYTAELVAQQYPAARQKFEYLAERFRRHLLTPGPYLYVFKEIRATEDVRRLRDLLSARSPDHLFQLLLVDNRGAVNQVLNEFRGQAVKGWLPGGVCDKAPERQWEGDDAAWDAILDRFALDVHADGGVRHDGPPPWSVLPTPKRFDLKQPPTDGWRVLLQAEGAQSFGAQFDFVDPLKPDARPVEAAASLMLQAPSPEAHFFCAMRPVSVLQEGAWVRVTLDWPPGAPPAVRMSMSLQDHGCRHYALASKAEGDKVRFWGRVSRDVEDVRLVFTPPAGEVAYAPSAVLLELHAPAIVAADEAAAGELATAEYFAPKLDAPQARPGLLTRIGAWLSGRRST